MLKKFKKTLPILVLILITGFVFRFYKLDSRAIFTWDQNRDIQEVSKIVKELKPTLIGPIVQGDAGFFLGPLYYYLLIPGFIISSGNPSYLAITSIIIQMLSIFLLLYFVKDKYKPLTTVSLALILISSWFLLEESKVSWNAALIFPYTLSALIATEKLRITKNVEWFLFLAFLLGLSSHVHLSVIPVVPVLLVPHLKLIIKFLKTPKNAILSIIFLLIPLSPLLLFDLRHNFLNTKLTAKFFSDTQSTSVSTFEMLRIIFDKWFNTLSYWIIGRKIAFSGLLFTLTFAIHALQNHSKPLIKSSLLIILINFASLLIYNYPGFADYYFLPSLVPSFIILADLLFSLNKKPLLLALATLLIIYLNVSAYNFQPNQRSIKVKKQIAQSVLTHTKNAVDVRYELDPGKADGIEYILNFYGLEITQQAPNKVVLQDSYDKDPETPNAKNIRTEQISSYKIVMYSIK